ncbi:MAG: hypothetical protein ABIO39_14240 [Caulobacteraceae bacterium]
MAGKPWFAPKQFGYGSGLPISWEGWAVLAVFIAGVLAAALLTQGALRIGLFVLMTAAMVGVCAAKTRGGWRWRSGGED